MVIECCRTDPLCMKSDFSHLPPLSNHDSPPRSLNSTEDQSKIKVRIASMPKRIWVTWEKQRRNVTISRALNCELFEFNLRMRRLLRYPVALVLTLVTFVRERPAIIFVQNPSIVLSAFAVAYGRLFRIPVVVDTHNAGVDPLDGKSVVANAITRFIQRRAALTILSNQALADTLRPVTGLAPIAILPDPIPDLEPPARKPTLRGKTNVLFICTWADDEPFLEVIKAAALLPPDTVVYITGRSRNQEAAYGPKLPDNVVLTGYLSETDYVALLFACDVVVDLTTRENCLVCGGYEAVAAERAVILSATEALKTYFHRGALYTDNTCPDLAQRIREATATQQSMSSEVRSLKTELIRNWQADKGKLEAALARVSHV
jgi:glycosyltransferase involved in cell wall biosynthesis